MQTHISRYFLKLLVITVILSVTSIGFLWLWDSYSAYRRDIIAIPDTYLKKQKKIIRSQVERTLSHIGFIRSRIRFLAAKKVREQSELAVSMIGPLLRNSATAASDSRLAEQIREMLEAANQTGIQGRFFAITDAGAPVIGDIAPKLAKHIQRLCKGENVLCTYPDPGRKEEARPPLDVILACRHLPELHWITGVLVTGSELESLAQKTALQWLREYRWQEDKKNYIFVGQWDGLMLVAPEPAQGRNMLQVVDVNGIHIVQEFIRLARKGGGYIQYVMPKLKGVRPVPKLTYIGAVPDWQWYVGTGVYIDEIQSLIASRRAQLKKEFRHHIFQAISLLLLLILAGLGMVFVVARRLEKNLAPFTDFFHRASTDLVQLEDKHLDFTEFKALAQEANAMIRERNNIQQILKQQETILNALTRASHQLLSGDDPDHAVTEALAIIGQACQVDRVSIFEAEQMSDQSRVAALRYEWTSGVKSRMDDPRFKHLSSSLLKDSWAEALRQGQAVLSSIDDFSGEAGVLTRDYDIKNILMLPILYRNEFWGMLCLDTCSEEISWSENTIQSLQNFASTLCTAIMQRRSEAEATKIRDQWIHTFHSIRDAIFLLDSKGKVVNANQAALQLAGLNDPADLHGRSLPNILHGKGTRYKACLAELTMQRGVPLTDEVYSSTLNKVFLASSFPVQDQNGTISGSIYIARDVTREKNMERQLVQARKMEAIGTLAGGIAHDFNNILAAIMGFAELAQVKLQHDAGRGLEEDLEQILRAGRRARDLITQLLAFSRSQNRQKIHTRVTPILEDTVQMLRAFVPANITITPRFAPETQSIFGDPTALHQVFMNLGSNAAQAMKEHGGELTIILEETPPPTAHRQPDGEEAGQYLHIVFSDQGGGIDPAIVEKIYDPFFTTKEVGEGTGMGLAAVHGIIEDHDGLLELENHPGRGATFHIYLPQVGGQTDPGAGLEPIATITGTACERVLVIDDEKILLTMYRDMLTLLGCTVISTSSPKEALAILAEDQTIDLLCTDYDMPEMNGIELAKACHRIRPNLPVLLSSGLSINLDPEELRRAGIKAILAKPLTLKELQKALLGLVNTA